MNQKPLFSFLLIWPIFISIESCTSLRMIPDARPKEDLFSRTFPVAFQEFHPRLNQVLQKYAQENPGNSFQIALLGNDRVVIRGIYRGPQSQVRLPLAIIVNPVERGTSRLEIRIPSDAPAGSFDSLKDFAARLFEIMEKEISPLP